MVYIMLYVYVIEHCVLLVPDKNEMLQHHRLYIKLEPVAYAKTRAVTNITFLYTKIEKSYNNNIIMIYFFFLPMNHT